MNSRAPASVSQFAYLPERDAPPIAGLGLAEPRPQASPHSRSAAGLLRHPRSAHPTPTALPVGFQAGFPPPPRSPPPSFFFKILFI